ncbi:hypothetical protein Pmani_038757 [Petrolisthes manimaculis]|uniref:Uncharacterized protein n=1 Tax=Petrolisthes manimaculis TaxID=1843537 RepID=A0AAE1NFM4_9EUCA|nr:hypothetical protein Pmani_038757 [Petrolisthes manimaculis]
MTVVGGPGGWDPRRCGLAPAHINTDTGPPCTHGAGGQGGARATRPSQPPAAASPALLPGSRAGQPPLTLRQAVCPLAGVTREAMSGGDGAGRWHAVAH